MNENNQEMMDVFLNRRSIRSYTGEPVPMEKLNQIIMAGLSSASSRSIRPWDLIVVRDKNMLINLSGCRLKGSSRMLAGADAAIIVVGNEELSDTWIEDCSIALTCMHLAAEEAGVGSCWIQIHLRRDREGGVAEENVRRILGLEEQFRTVGILALGVPAESPEPHRPEEADFGQVRFIG